MTLTGPTWTAGERCEKHDLPWCHACKPASPKSKPKPDRTNPVPQRKKAPQRSGFTWAPPPETPLNNTTRVFAPKSTDASQPPKPAVMAWRYQHELRPWQAEALAAWDGAGRRGVVEAATGTGKTAVALVAAERMRREFGTSLRVVVVVPTIALASQWREAMTRELGVHRSLVGELHSGERSEFSSGSHVLVTVINSARNTLQDRIASWRRQGLQVLLVVDECHRAGSDHNARVVDTEATATLGLSATPERADRGHATLVYPGLGNPVYRYPVLTALDDGVLAPLQSINLYVDFTTDESVVWNQQGRDLGQAIQVLESRYPGTTSDVERMWKRIGELAKDEVPEAMRVVALLARRADVLAKAENRQKCLVAVLDWLAANDERVIVFHERITQAVATERLLVARGVASMLDHSQLRRSERSTGLGRFKRGQARALVAVRSLDEGIDVPDASIAVIASGSRSPRQRIQRLGRILRRSGDKRATCISILVRGTADETYVGARDAQLVGSARVVHHRWPGRSITDAASQPSSYQPMRPRQDLVDRLTAIDVIGLGASRVLDHSGPVGALVTAPKLSGGYVAAESTFSPNAWHPVEEVRNAAGMPAEVFDRFRPIVRQSFVRSLDPVKVADTSLIHGSEIEAIRRMWKQGRSGRGM